MQIRYTLETHGHGSYNYYPHSSGSFSYEYTMCMTKICKKVTTGLCSLLAASPLDIKASSSQSWASSKVSKWASQLSSNTARDNRGLKLANSTDHLLLPVANPQHCYNGQTFQWLHSSHLLCAAWSSSMHRAGYIRTSCTKGSCSSSYKCCSLPEQWNVF